MVDLNGREVSRGLTQQKSEESISRTRRLKRFRNEDSPHNDEFEVISDERPRKISSHPNMRQLPPIKLVLKQHTLRFGCSSMGARLLFLIVLLVLPQKTSVVEGQPPPPDVSAPTVTTVPAAPPTLAPAVPSNAPSSISSAPSSNPPTSNAPSLRPSQQPSASPTTTFSPTISMMPSTQPTQSFMPSTSPSTSPKPSIPPSWQPTLTAYPSAVPSSPPSDVPSSAPTTSETIEARKRFQQVFIIPGPAFFNDNETDAMMNLYASYTKQFAPGNASSVTTEFEFRPPQKIVPDPNSTIISNTADYAAYYSSHTVNVTDYPIQFLEYVNENLTKVTLDLRNLGLNVSDAKAVRVVIVETMAPTASEAPSMVPSLYPTITSPPSTIPTVELTDKPKVPTAPPSIDYNPVSIFPTPAPTKIAEAASVPVAVIASITVLCGVGILIVLVFYYRRRVKHRQSLRRAGGAAAGGGRKGGEAAVGGGMGMGGSSDREDFAVPTMSRDSDMAVGGVLSPTSSHLSGKSLVSEGDSGLLGEDSGDELDGTKNLQDEFDQYKDQNLEQLRSEIEGNLPGFDGVLSAAVTKALMGQDVNLDMSDFWFGCHYPATGEEVEASVLCDVCDWLKRNESGEFDKKNAFMSELLNKMVTNVRHDKILADVASRTIHESAALLGLPLANELPMTTMIISGMRKTVAANSIVNVVDEFGDIDTAAVASGERGFGIVRFRNPKSVERAMRKYRNAEIVVEDVAVQIRVLMPSGEVISRT